jgi:Kef-type K+ transport system membrane component KefB/nucleotide-binding universal stress UspA family protein
MRARQHDSLPVILVAMAAVSGFLFLLVHQALAAPRTPNSTTETVFIAEIVVLLVFGRLLGEAVQRLGQPAVVGQLLAGIVIGPSVLGALFPQAEHFLFPPSPEQTGMLRAISQLGILMLLLLTGMETDLALVRKVKAPAFLVALCGIAVPFAFGFALGQFLPASILPATDKRLITSLFLGTALSISSIKIVAVVIRDMNFMRRNLGQIIVASAILEDTAGWIIISITLSIAARGRFELIPLCKTVFGIALFLAASLTLGRPLVFRLIRSVNDLFQSDFAVISAILALMCAMALVTSAMGVQSVLGAFVAGVLVGESPILTRHIEAQLRGLISALFMPVFFGVAGLGANLAILGQLSFLVLAFGLILVASVGKFAGAWLGAAAGGLSGREALALGCAMNARGSTEVIVASIGLSAGAITQNLFTMILAMAVLTTMLMPSMLRKALANLPMSEEERARLEREEIDARGFVNSLERLLLAVDESAAGKLAARLAGLVAGARGTPMTIVKIPAMGAEDAKESGPKIVETAAHAGIRAGAASTKEHEGEEHTRKVDVSTQKSADGLEQNLHQIAHKGFDLLFVGVAGSRTSDGQISEKLTRIVREIDSTLALVIADQEGGSRGLPTRGSRILVPVTGTALSRRGAEVAFLLARPLNAAVTALYVSTWPQVRSLGKPSRLSMTRRNEEAVLKDIAGLAGRYGVDVRTAIEAHSSPDIPILKLASRHDLIVMGVQRRPGDVLFLGNTAARIMSRVHTPTLFIAE